MDALGIGSNTPTSISRSFASTNPFTHGITTSSPISGPSAGVDPSNMTLDSTTPTSTPIPPSLVVDMSHETRGIIMKHANELPTSLHINHELIPLKGLKLYCNY